jgi:hypothetical protein
VRRLPVRCGWVCRLLGGYALLAQAPEGVQEPGAEGAVLVLVQDLA